MSLRPRIGRKLTSYHSIAGNRAHITPMTSLNTTPGCENDRCATSVLANQLWYWSSTTKQLMSTFTHSSIPPLLRGEALVTGWGPNNQSLVNIPICAASAPREPARPSRIPQPPAVLPTAAAEQDVWPARQVWAGPLSGGAFVVVLWNLGQTAAAVNATWSEIGLQQSVNAYSVRDLWNHSWRANVTASTGVVGALVQSHDVVALKLTPIR